VVGVVAPAIVALPLSFMSSEVPDVALLDPPLFAAVTATLSALPTSVADTTDVCFVAEELVASACAAAAARIPDAMRSKNRRRTGRHPTPLAIRPQFGPTR
jgi:hypothetical protein